MRDPSLPRPSRAFAPRGREDVGAAPRLDGSGGESFGRGSGRIVSARRGAAHLPRGVEGRLRGVLTDARRFLDVRGPHQGGGT